MNEGNLVERLASALEADADTHEAGRHEAVGERFDDLEGEVTPFWHSQSDALSMGLHFWDCWVDARNHDWKYYPGVEQADWPRLAREVARALRSGQQPEAVPAMLLGSSPSLRRRVKDWMSRRAQ